MDTRVSTGTRLTLLPILIALLLNLVIGPFAPIASPTSAAPTPGVVVELQDGVNECMGIRTTPGSENTKKMLDPNDPGDLRPGGTANFILEFPANEFVDRGGADFEVTDCVFINGNPVLKYIIQAPNNPVGDTISFTIGLQIPADAPIGAEYCNYARSEETPSDPQRSNRKAGPACFIIGGALRVEKVDQSGAPLAGATFSVACTFPTTTSTLTALIISAPAGATGAAGTVSPDGTDADAVADSSESYAAVSGTTRNATVVTGTAGTIEVQAPVGTSCTFTETFAPLNHSLPADPDCTIVVTLGQQQTCRFVNVLNVPNLEVSKTPDGEIVNAGEEIDFTITVTNNGPGVATNVDIDDHLPAGFTWSEDPDKTECSITTHLDHQDLHCDIASLASGASFSVTVSAPTDSGDCSTTAYLNTARADADNHAEVTNTGDITIQCPDASVVKEAVNAVIDAGTNASFTIVVSADGDSDSENVVLTDLNPAGSGRTWTVSGANSAACTDLSIAPGETLTCNFGTIPDGQSRTITITSSSSTADCTAAIANTASITSTADVDLSNNQDSASIVVECPGLNLVKSATTGEVVAGQVARFEIRVWNAGPGDALSATVHDDLPAGLSWNVQLQSPDGDDNCTVASSTTPGGATQMSFDCTFGTLPVTNMAGGKLIVVTATTDNTDCGVLNNTASADASNHGAPLTSSASITVRCPTLVVDKVASTETITISGPANALVATPSVVTWTLSYTLTNGPVTGAVITDQVPTGFTFLDAANGGTFASGTVTWNLGTLTTSGSVTFRTTVNPATISRTGPTVNTAIIDSNETAPDNGQDSVTVTVEAPPLGGTPTPRPPLPNTATGIGSGGAPVTVPVELLVVFFIGSLGALALANVRASSRRR